MEIKEISEIKVNGETAPIPIELAEDQVFGYYKVADKIRKNAAAAASLEKQLDAYNDMWYDESLYGCETTESYSIRETANGAKVVNGSKAKLKKVEGNTVVGKNLCKPFRSRERESTKQQTEPRNLNGSKYLFRFAVNNNLFNVEATTGNNSLKISGDTVTFNSSSTTALAFDVPCVPGRKYTISIFDNDEPIRISYGYYDVNGNYLDWMTAEDSNVVTTEREAPKNAAFLMVGVSSVSDFSKFITFSKVQVEEGTEATEYEPYFEDLKHITFEGIKSTGKNLLKPMSQRTLRNIGDWNVPRKWDGNTVVFEMSPNYYAPNENISIHGNYATFKPNQASPGYGIAFDMPCIEGKTYTISVGYSSVNWRSNYGTYDKDGNIKRSRNANTVTINEGEAWLVWDIAPVEKNMEITIGDIQVEYGDTPTAYEPYKESTLNFSNIELPLGKTVDFDTKTITDYGVTIVCDTELISKANFARNGSGFILVNVLPKEEEPKRIGVSSIGYAVSGTGEPRVQVAYTGGQKNILFIGLPFWKGMDDSDNQDFKDWLQKLADAGTPLTIRYLSTVATTESFDEENEYTVWKGGTEQILGNSLESYDIHPTITQDYLIIKQEENN